MFRKIITLFVVVTMVAIGLIGVVPRITQVARAMEIDEGGRGGGAFGGGNIGGGGGGGVIDPSPVAEGTGEALSTQSVADKVASELGGNVSKIDGDVNSWKVNIPNGKRPIIVRIMEAGSGGRANPYFRVSVDGKPALTLEGKFSSDHGLTHFDLSNESVQQILNIIDKYRGR
nr:hypothetical protein [Bacilli bacterium]